MLVAWRGESVCCDQGDGGDRRKSEDLAGGALLDCGEGAGGAGGGGEDGEGGEGYCGEVVGYAL